MNREKRVDLSLLDLSMIAVIFFQMNILAYAGAEVVPIALSFIYL